LNTTFQIAEAEAEITELQVWTLQTRSAPIVVYSVESKSDNRDQSEGRDLEICTVVGVGNQSLTPGFKYRTDREDQKRSLVSSTVLF
jgi:hypothetical protein